LYRLSLSLTALSTTLKHCSGACKQKIRISTKQKGKKRKRNMLERTSIHPPFCEKRTIYSVSGLGFSIPAKNVAKTPDLRSFGKNKKKPNEIK
jgi:hypothetical protein